MVQNFLKTVPDIETVEEFNSLYCDQEEELYDALEKYCWNSFGWGTGWIHVCSRYVKVKQEEHQPVEHRLYLNTDSLDTYPLVNLLVDKFKFYNIPYYFKFEEHGTKDDPIVIYSSTKYLSKYIEILNEIKKENPKLISNVHKPPILTGKIDNWIGYGSEPKSSSFNNIRAKHISDVIKKTTYKWILTNKNMIIKYNDREFTLQDFIVYKSTEKILGFMKANFDKTKEQISEQEFVKEYGYTLADINSNTMQDSIYNIIKNNINYSLNVICNGGKMEDIEMVMRYDNKLSLHNSDLTHTLIEIAKYISKHDSNFSKDVKDEIDSSSPEYGIDPANYCFDNYAVKLMKEYDSSPVRKLEDLKEEALAIEIDDRYEQQYSMTM